MPRTVWSAANRKFPPSITTRSTAQGHCRPTDHTRVTVSTSNAPSSDTIRASGVTPLAAYCRASRFASRGLPVRNGTVIAPAAGRPTTRPGPAGPTSTGHSDGSRALSATTAACPRGDLFDSAECKPFGCTTAALDGDGFDRHESSVSEFRPVLVAGPDPSGLAGGVSAVGWLTVFGFCHRTSHATCSSGITLLYGLYNTSGEPLEP
jgi:hypothetical protein